MSYRYGHNFKKNEKGVMYVSRPEERKILVGKIESVTIIRRLNPIATGYMMFCSVSLHHFLFKVLTFAS